ncbi:MAG: DNA polymerase III subunit delta [Bacilli bacterium]|nr:DNA polymerase III subunit delta [Bacilli bacterium]
MIHLYFAEQDLMAKEAASKAIRKAFPERNEVNFIALDMLVTPFKVAAAECEMLPLGYDSKCVLLENCNFFKRGVKIKTLKDDNIDYFKEYLYHPNPDVELYMVLQGTPDTRGEFFRLLEENQAEIREVKPLDANEWPSYIQSFFEKQGGGIDSAATYELSKRIDGDYGRFKSETQKLLSYAMGEKITLKMVETLVTPYVEDDVFKMSNSLLRNDPKTALHIYHDLKNSGHGEEIRLIGNLANSFLFLDQVRYLDARGYDKMQIAQELNVSPIRAEIARKSLYRIKGDRLVKALEKLYELDRQILSGKIDAELGFSLYLANFRV